MNKQKLRLNETIFNYYGLRARIYHRSPKHIRSAKDRAYDMPPNRGTIPAVQTNKKVTYKKKIMQNYILINRTYSEITPESCEDADFSDHGFISENEAVTFTELVELMKRHPQASQWPNSGSHYVWYSTGYQVEDYGTGTEREECLHFHSDNTPNVAKYWKWAAKIAGHIK